MGTRVRQNPEATFEVYAEVTYPVATGTDPEVRRQFPEDYGDQEILQTLTKFCFPFYVDSITVGQVGQNFTFVLTDIDSKQRFGFCRLSSGAKTCFCILSYLPWFEVFYKLLNILADYTAKSQDSQWYELLDTLYKLPIPQPGSSVHLSVHSYFTVPDIRELPSIPENRNLTEYFVAVDVNNMLHLYASMLYERRILICCSKLSTVSGRGQWVLRLTACIHGSAAMLYPMFWQHVYIPVLPPHLLDYCCAPMPYLIGIHLSLMEKVRTMALEDVVILNVDTNTLETPFDDLQSLPNDVVSALKSRLKKVSMTTGDGVARAFLKAQAAFFGSYRSALKIEPGEPITFCEETFASHRSATMRQFLQNAIQLQLFKQFIDGRLDLLNSGEGFSDVFEEEINMSEYAGSDKLYHQWLSTVRKGSGAILNTVKTKANPAMKTVYKFAKDHARMGIKEVKNRLKQKDIAENGCATVPEDTLPRTAPSPPEDKRDPRLREERRPITVHFGQVRPPRPHVSRRPKSNVPLDGRRTSVSSPEHLVKPTRHYTVFLSEDSSGDEEFPQEDDPGSAFSDSFLFSAPFEWPQPYRTLKESDSAEGEGGSVPARPRAGPPTPDSPAEVSLLESLFSGLDVDAGAPPPLSQARSLEDLRIPSQEAERTPTFDYQRMDPGGTSEKPWPSPGMKPPPPYRPLCVPGPGRHGPSQPMRPALPRAVPGTPGPPAATQQRRHPGRGREGPGGRPPLPPGEHHHPASAGQEDPEGEHRPPPPAPGRPGSCPFRTWEPQSSAPLSNPHSVSRPGFNAHHAGGATEMLQPVRVTVEGADHNSDFLLTLLDPLKGGGSGNLLGFPPTAGDLVPPVPPLFGHPLATPPFAPPSSLNPFVPAVPLSLARPPGSPFAPSLGHAYSSGFITSASTFYPPQRPPPNPLALSMPNLFAQSPVAPVPSPSATPYPAQLPGPSKTRTLPLAGSASKAEAKARLAERPVDLPLPPLKARPQVKDPFEELLAKTKQEVSVTPGKVEQLRRQWETFE
nr:PREDICTED: LOW QUALITY PROTEIN: DENN domain-containing protein 1A [Anolis carolinensis]|eukprot:XP_008122194.2 PREDICTED: LOW QUALITY PROTEIN: DENN domain-containing protein 1A [Anolis carolinensis]